MISIEIIKDVAIKRYITKKILTELPEHFGIDSAIKDYINGVKETHFLAAKNQGEYVGFYALKAENPKVLNLYVLGILKAYQNQGIGKRLQASCERYAREHSFQYLMVLTLATKANHKPYLRTHRFYQRMGFIDFFQSDELFDEHNPALIMLKAL